MCKFWLTLWLVFLFVQPTHAIEFSIYDSVVSGLDISLTASLSASSNYYLQGLLRSQLSTKYFGETQNNKGDWIDYVSSPEKESITSNFYLTEVKDSTWSGQVKIRFKIDDPNYLGPGIYDLKLRRFTGNSSSSAGESNTLQINLTVPLPTPTPSPSIPPSPTPAPSPSIKPSVFPSPVLSPPPVGTVAGTSTEIDLSSPTPITSDLSGDSRKAPQLNRTRARTAIIVGSGLIILSVTGYFAYRKYLSQKSLTDL